MPRPKILVTRATFPDIVDRLSEHADVVRNENDRVLTRSELIGGLADKDGALISGLDKIDAGVVAGAPKLRMLASFAAGYNNLDLPALSKAGIMAANTPGLVDQSVADFTWGLMLAAARRVVESDVWLRTGAWKGWAYDQFIGADIHGTTLGIIGMGRIGQAVARRAAGFEMRVLYHNRTRLPASIEAACKAHYAESKDALLAAADHVVLALPYTPDAQHMIGARELEIMKPSATLINIARGGIVDDGALAEALKTRRIAAAALDVFEGEPDVHPALIGLPNVVLCPHIASASIPTRRAMANLAVDNLLAGLGIGPHAGRPPNVLNPDVLQLRS
jgi:glyoxylate/hydroxypyruvate/2-ketogluconate reductase